MMNPFVKRMKRKAFRRNVELKQAIQTPIQLCKEMPSEISIGNVKTDGINADDLFSILIVDN